jgi:hypothetical protein
MFVDVMPAGVLLPLVKLPPAVVPPPTALAPPDVETPNVDVVGKLVATALDAGELPDPLLLVTNSPLFRLALVRALEFNPLAVLLGVPLGTDCPVELGVAADPAKDEPPATIDAAVLATLVRREPVACGGGVEAATLTIISPNCSGSESRPSISSGS